MVRIAVDMDEVIADTVSRLLEWYAGEFGGHWTREMLNGQGFRGLATPEQYERMQRMLHQGDFFADLPVMPHSQAVMEELHARHEVFVASAAMEYPASCAAKHAWLRRNFPFVQDERIVFCGDKSILRADYLIDDHNRHFRRFAGQGVLFHSPHNLHVTGYPRVRDWMEVRRMFLDETGIGRPVEARSHEE